MRTPSLRTRLLKHEAEVRAAYGAPDGGSLFYAASLIHDIGRFSNISFVWVRGRLTQDADFCLGPHGEGYRPLLPFIFAAFTPKEVAGLLTYDGDKEGRLARQVMDLLGPDGVAALPETVKVGMLQHKSAAVRVAIMTALGEP